MKTRLQPITRSGSRPPAIGPKTYEHSKCAPTRATLAEIHNRFTEGFGNADLREAKAPIDELVR